VNEIFALKAYTQLNYGFQVDPRLKPITLREFPLPPHPLAPLRSRRCYAGPGPQGKRHVIPV